MLNEFPEEKKNLKYMFYFDNLFSGPNLLNRLRENGYGATGTVRWGYFDIAGSLMYIRVG